MSALELPVRTSLHKTSASIARRRTASSWLVALFVAFVAFGPIAKRGWSQAGLRDALAALDKDEDGRIGPDEITPLARPYLERIAEVKRLSLNRENDISEFQEASRIYHAKQNGMMEDRVRAKRTNDTLLSLEPDDDMTRVPEFGLAEVKYQYNGDDIEEADDTIRRCDRNGDGFISREEARRNRWTHRDPFDMDLNNDNQLSRMELIQRYARRRMLDDAAGELIQKARRVGNGIASSRSRDNDDDDDRRDSSWWRRGGNSTWLAASMIGRFDRNRNGRLDETEAQDLGIPMGLLDVDRDGEVTRDELLAYTEKLQQEQGDPGQGIPGWFYELDSDRDGQVSMVEFTDDWTDQKIDEFAMLDANEDGLITTNEILQSKTMMGGTYTNDVAEILPPRKTIISEIEVPEDLTIGDLNVQISVTHTHTDALDGYLTGPDGQRIELFTGIGGSGDHFQDTTFDDQARQPITKARSPFEGSFQPEGLVKRGPGLNHFNGQNAKGVWQLVIRATRSDRFGMLHQWKLMFRNNETEVSESYLASLAEIGEDDEGEGSLRISTRGSDDRDSRKAPAQRSVAPDRGKAESRAREAAQAWVNAAGPEQAARRQAALERWNSYVEEAKREGRAITGDDKRKIFAEFSDKSKPQEKSDRGRERR